MDRIKQTLKRSPVLRAVFAFLLLGLAGYALWVAGVGLVEGEIRRMGGRPYATFVRSEEPLGYWWHLLSWAAGGLMMLLMLARSLFRRGLSG